jgi:SAM-dependent methyltransferase
MSGAHFDHIAHEYDAQIPLHIREHLTNRKVEQMNDVSFSTLQYGAGLDIGCGQGYFLSKFPFCYGLDVSSEQVLYAKERNPTRTVTCGSITKLPYEDSSLHYVFMVNVYHHLSWEERAYATTEIVRVLKPGGVFFLHEINTRNVLVKFWMNYVFPRYRSIDDGSETWVHPHSLPYFPHLRLADIRYFGMIPDFIPKKLMPLAKAVECVLELTPLKYYGSHYMAVWRKSA